MPVILIGTIAVATTPRRLMGIVSSGYWLLMKMKISRVLRR
jgi:hypothetical protein